MANSTHPPPKPQRNTVPTYALVKRSPGVSAPVPNLVYSAPRAGSQNERSSSFPPHGHFHDGRPRVGAEIYSTAGENFDSLIKRKECSIFAVLDPAGYISSPERTPRYISEDPYYYPPPSRSGSVTPVVIDEEARFRMEHMERQLANLTGLVQKALAPPPPSATSTANPAARTQSSTLPRNVGATNYSLVMQQRDYIPSRDFRGKGFNLSSRINFNLCSPCHSKLKAD